MEDRIKEMYYKISETVKLCHTSQGFLCINWFETVDEALTFFDQDFPCEQGKETEYWTSATKEEKKDISPVYWKDLDILFNGGKGFVCLSGECAYNPIIIRESNYKDKIEFLEAVFLQIEDLRLGK